MDQPARPQNSAAPLEALSWRQGVASLVASAILLGLGVYILSGYLHALLWALVLAVAVWPLYGRFKRRFGPSASKELAPALFALLVGLVILAPIAGLAVDAAAEFRQLLDYARAAEETGLPVPDALARLPGVGAWASQWWAEHLSHAGWAKELAQQLNTSSAREIGASLSANIAHRSILFAISLLTLFFLFRSGESLVSQCRIASTKLFGARGELLAAQMIASVHGTLIGLVLVALGEGVLMGAAYMLSHTPHPILLGVLTAFAAMIPFAAAFAIGLAALLAAATAGMAPALIIAAWGVVVVFAADHFVRPNLIGSAIKLPFIWVLLGILGGAESFQLLGLFIGPAIMAALMALWRELSSPEGV
ncbi:AI-2E family transporter [Methylocystis sp. JR02]|uniref:AI-2E family transporter n=1 Tax=Methylocystis sp. JR02 TaxID=3046284 RepID=UPI0024BA2C1E|nr:AI-2E family transporter [Methylocystis sp. JR02]MDJ0448683.1 AI-2E family transporter [Methylocystis sp. JR02]